MIVRAVAAQGPGLALALLLWTIAPVSAIAQDALPPLTEPVNDFARVIDQASRARLDNLIRRLESATGDTIIVATRDTIAPFADERELAVKWYENRGRGIGDKEKDAGVLFVLLPKERAVWIEVGYGLEGAITDGFSGSVSRELMRPLFREGRYGEGLVAGVTAVAERIAKERNVSLGALPEPPRAQPRQRERGMPLWLLVLLLVLFLWLSSRGGGPGGRRRRGGSMWGPAWSGWGTGMITGGAMGGFGGGGFGGGSFGGGGFGGFGGGMSGGGGGGARW